MAGLLPNVDPDGLLEFSVVFTDRSLNHMSQSFQGVMTDISETLKKASLQRSGPGKREEGTPLECDPQCVALGGLIAG